MPEIAIIGAGFAGICMAIRLRQAGIDDFTVYEKADALGGVWRDNTYPGAGCDIPSVLYSYSFAQRADWSRVYPEQREILRYLHECAEGFDVVGRIRFDTEVFSAGWHPDESVWRLETSRGSVSARAVVSAVGQLNRPRLPDVPGLDTFAGTAFHSARWRHDHDLTDRTVAVIGTGPSAVQFVPRIAERVRKLYVFQRSANWVVPKPDRAYGPTARRVFRLVPPARLAVRGATYLRGETAVYWAVRGDRRGTLVEKTARRHLAAQIADPDLRRRLTPDFPIGCKRILISQDFYPTLTRDNVELVTDPITEVTARGPQTAVRGYDVDTLIHGTGFLATEFLRPMEIVGRDGVRLHDVWREGAAAHLGIDVPRFPNLFLLYGPGTNLGHNSIVYMIESQVAYVVRKLRGGRVHEVGEDRYLAAHRALVAGLAGTALEADCTSWYKGADGRVTTNWPWRTYRYRLATRSA
ncbi:flavin-containing monooxygenase [Embleya sp. NPDC020886]|uniref:flavin-containing monooxygenase n=1 Tax=Embleya sp. NPDC020886 TaxID=3363980 RepID=UPI0037ACDEC1